MNANYDVLIAGAGPSGISCGITLQKQGVKCCIIDKAKFPREKLCGGLLTNKAYNKILELTDGNTDIVDAATLQVVSRVSIARNIEILNSSNVDIPIRIIDRTILDGELVSYYKKIGGIIKEEEIYKNYNLNDKIVESDKDKYKTNYLVKAIGASSKSSNANIGFCLEAFVKKEDLLLEEKNSVIIDFGIIDKGYAWIFPSGEYYKIGFGNLYNKGFDYKKRFIEYLQQLNVKNYEKYEINGAFVPYGKCEDKHNIDDFCILLGDQAGMTDPLYGEGLYFAYKTGIVLANTLNKGLKNKKLNYDNRIDDDKKQVNYGHKLKTIFFNKIIQGIFAFIIRRKKKLIKFYVDEQVSQYKYSHSDIFGLALGYKGYHYEK